MATVKLTQGDTINEVITIYESDGTTVVDITGGTIKFRIVSSLGDAKADAVYNDEAVTITDAASGEATLAVARSVTKIWTPGNYYWEVEYIDSSSNHSHTYSDILIIKKSIYSGD